MLLGIPSFQKYEIQLLIWDKQKNRTTRAELRCFLRIRNLELSHSGGPDRTTVRVEGVEGDLGAIEGFACQQIYVYVVMDCLREALGKRTTGCLEVIACLYSDEKFSVSSGIPEDSQRETDVLAKHPQGNTLSRYYKRLPVPYLSICHKVIYTLSEKVTQNAMEKHAACFWCDAKGDLFCSCVGSTELRMNRMKSQGTEPH